MSRHRAGPGRRRARPESRHRAQVRPRYGRIATLTASLAVTVVAVVGGAGLLPTPSGDADPASAVAKPDADDVQKKVAEPDRDRTLSERDDVTPAQPEVATDAEEAASLPAGSGEGRRVVFSESRQRVWLVDSDRVVRTYPVSGSVYDNLDPGTFEVYSRSESAVGVDDSGTMRYFVRFTTGDQGAAIGFHDIPVDDGRPVQAAAELGTPQSHGCIRQRTEDAIALWEFAPIGTTVVVTA